MAEIIKNGNYGTPKQCTCPYCHAVFKYDKRDLHSTGKTRIWERRYYVWCPACRSKIETWD